MCVYECVLLYSVCVCVHMHMDSVVYNGFGIQEGLEMLMVYIFFYQLAWS